MSAIPEFKPATNGWLILLHAHDHCWNREPFPIERLDACKMFSGVHGAVPVAAAVFKGKRLNLMIELYAGLHGWGEGAITEGFQVIGFDILDMCAALGHSRPKGIELVLQDVLTLHGSQFKDATCIVASPPCQAYSYRAMPWKRAKALPPPDNTLFEACFRIQREACEAAGRYIPLVVENVRGAQKWVGRAQANFGSYYLWGDVGMVGKSVVAGVPRFGQVVKARSPGKFNPDGTGHPAGSWFAIADSKNRGTKGIPHRTNGLDWSKHGTPGYKAQGFNVTAAQRLGDHERIEESGVKARSPGHYSKPGSGDDWFDNGPARHRSGSDSRKAASAQIAKIPFPLAQYIAQAFKVDREA